MTVLKNPAGSATVEVTAVEAAESASSPVITVPSGDPAGLRLSTVACFGATVFVYLVGAVLADIGAPIGLVAIFRIAAALMFGLSIVVALVRALIGLVRMVSAIGAGSELSPFEEAMRVLGNLFMAGLGIVLGYLGTIGFARGRQLRRRGRVLLPDLRENGEWADLGTTLHGADVPAGLADQWRENGKTEHASVAAFARLTLDLMALGAPPRLVAAANQDALDEIRHTELCFSLATALDGKRIGPAPFPVAQRVSPLSRLRRIALAQLAVSSLVDGALHEGVSARIIARLAKRSEVPAIRDLLKSIAADEGRHSAHGWSVVEWCVEQGGASVRSALQGAMRALPDQMRSQLPEPATGGGWERWGIHGHALEAEEYAKAVALLDARVRALASASVRRAA